MIMDQRKECDMAPCGKKGLPFTARMVPRRPQSTDHTVGANQRAGQERAARGGDEPLPDDAVNHQQTAGRAAPPGANLGGDD